MAIGGGLPTAKVRAIYRSLTHAEFVLVDKENGGRADALNAGINVARYPLICLIDADSLLEPNALTQAVLPFLESPDTLARRRHHPRRQRLHGRGRTRHRGARPDRTGSRASR